MLSEKEIKEAIRKGWTIKLKTAENQEFIGTITQHPQSKQLWFGGKNGSKGKVCQVYPEDLFLEKTETNDK